MPRDSSEGELGEVLDCLIERKGGEMDELVALAVVDTLWERLEGLRVARDGLGAFHSLIGGEGGGWGLVEQLLGEVVRLLCKLTTPIECLVCVEDLIKTKEGGLTLRYTQSSNFLKHSSF